MNEAITPTKPNQADPELMLKVAKLRNAGTTELEIMLYLSEKEGVEPQKATEALMAVRRAVGEAAMDFNPISQCIQGILTANDIQKESAKIHDNKGRLQAEAMRLKWVQELRKYIK